MLREYEFTFLTKSDVPENAPAKILSNYEEILLRNGGDILKKDDWGVKKLAYPIRENFKGHYVSYAFASLPENIAEAERKLRIDDNVLRYLVVKIGDRVDIEKRKSDYAKGSASPRQTDSM
ncbi:MAG: 30S ribosomal protein S6 [Oligoflexales bacterium]